MDTPVVVRALRFGLGFPVGVSGFVPGLVYAQVCCTTTAHATLQAAGYIGACVLTLAAVISLYHPFLRWYAAGALFGVVAGLLAVVIQNIVLHGTVIT